MLKTTKIILTVLTLTSLGSLIFVITNFSEEEEQKIQNDNDNKVSYNFLSSERESKISSPQTSYLCPHFQKRVLFAHRGGNITKYQENTLEVLLDSGRNNRAIEIDLMQVGSGEIIAFHDSNALPKMGVSLDIQSSPWNIVKNLTYLNSFDNRDYTSNPEIPLIKKALNAICNVNNRTSIWFDIKYAFDNEFIMSLLDDLDNSPCACDEGQKIVFEVFKDLGAVQRFKSLMRNRRCKLLAAMSLYNFQIGLGFDILRMQIGYYAGYADIVDFPSAMALKFPDLLKANYENNICNTVYGDNNTEIELVAGNPYLNGAIYNFYE